MIAQADTFAAVAVDDRLPARLRALIDVQLERGITRGMQVFVARHGKVLIDEAHGVRGQDDQEVTPETRFLIYSTSKSLTATAVHLLVERGEIVYSDPVAKFVPEFAAGGKESATIRHLLLHQGGFPDTESTLPAEVFHHLDDAVRAVCAMPAQFQPGTTTIYHVLTGATMLAEVVQRITGQDFASYCKEHIFMPLGMQHTSWGIAPSEEPDVSDTIGVDEESEAVSARYRSPEMRRAVAPAIGAYSTARDLGRFFQVWLDGGAPILSAPTCEHARQRHAPITETLGFGYGFFVGSEPSGSSRGTLCSAQTFGHPGMCSSQAYADPASGLVVAMLANLHPGQAASDRRFSILCDTVARALL
jgi:CubicO group peptidase (beta-lactamase class C family)